MHNQKTVSTILYYFDDLLEAGVTAQKDLGPLDQWLTVWPRSNTRDDNVINKLLEDFVANLKEGFEVKLLKMEEGVKGRVEMKLWLIWRLTLWIKRSNAGKYSSHVIIHRTVNYNYDTNYATNSTDVNVAESDILVSSIVRNRDSCKSPRRIFVLRVRLVDFRCSFVSCVVSEIILSIGSILYAPSNYAILRHVWVGFPHIPEDDNLVLGTWSSYFQFRFERSRPIFSTIILANRLTNLYSYKGPVIVVQAFLEPLHLKNN